MEITYFFDVCSCWCALADETLLRVRERYGARVPIVWKIALINNGDPIEAGLPQELWYYDRCEAATGRRFNHHWIEKPGQTTFVPNAVIYAARKLGEGFKVHNALRMAGLERGEPILRREVALAVAIAASGLDRHGLETAMDDPVAGAEISAWTAEFNSYRIDQRPAFVLRSAIGDTAILSGLYRPEPLTAAIDAMIADEDAYTRFAATHGPIPAL
jgi:predicted DsbA family dithiol-disulfide isomerase